jgi:hypothetical protein
MRSWSNQIKSYHLPAQTQHGQPHRARNTNTNHHHHPSMGMGARGSPASASARRQAGRTASLCASAPRACVRARFFSFFDQKLSPHTPVTRSVAWVSRWWCYSSTSRSRPTSRSGARGKARSAGADDASPVARLASQELSPSITPCPSGPPPADRGVAPGSVGVGPVGAAVVVAAPGPLDDFTLHVPSGK